jgi:hypothetical protein
MFAQEPPPDFDVPGRREPGERPELVAEVGLIEVACATGAVAPVDRSVRRGQPVSQLSNGGPARMRNGTPRLTMSTADGIGGSVSRAYGGAPSR